MGGYDFTLHCNGKALTLVLSANTHICGARTKEVGTRRTTSSEKLMQEGRKVLRKKKKKASNRPVVGPNCRREEKCRRDVKPLVPRRLMNVLLYQRLLLAKAGNGRAVLTRQAPKDVGCNWRALICHARPQHARRLVSCWPFSCFSL